MSGQGTLWVPPSGFQDAVAQSGSTWHRAIPSSPPISPFTGIANYTGLAPCNALQAMVPPSLLRAYDIYSLNIAWGAAFNDSVSETYAGNIRAELALLVNNEVRWVSTDDELATAWGFYAYAQGTITADLVNPIRLNTRENLALRLGVVCDVAPAHDAESLWFGAVGMQLNTGTSYWQGVPSTISYNIIDLPGARAI
jgi:hypothetical protein